MQRLFLALALLLAVPRLAEAHATLVRSTPKAGATLTVFPLQISLVFSEEIEAKLGRVVLRAANGAVTTVTVGADPHDVNALIGSVDALPNGSYSLEWSVVSADGHPVKGKFTFTVAATSAPVVAPPPPVVRDTMPVQEEKVEVTFPMLAAALRGLGAVALLALVGLLGFRRNAVATLSAESDKRSATWANWLAVAAALLWSAHLLVWLINITPTHSLGEAFGSTVGSDVARFELWRTGLVVLAFLALLLSRRRTLAFVFGAAALLVSGAVGHPAAITPLIAIPAKALHFAAGAAWLGGLVWLLSIARDDASLIAEGRRVSSAALACVLLVTVSGAVQAFLFLPSLLDLVRTLYGALVLVKVAGVGMLIAFGAQHRFRTLPRLEDDLSASRLFHGSLAREVAVMVVVIIVGGVLAYVSPTH